MSIRVGETYRARHRVGPEHLVHLGDPLPGVLSTPSLILFLELTARDLLSPLLPDGHCSVGTHVDIEHMAPALVDADVECVARVIHIDGPHVSLQVQATLQDAILGKGLHKRRIIDRARLARRFA